MAKLRLTHESVHATHARLSGPSAILAPPFRTLAPFSISSYLSLFNSSNSARSSPNATPVFSKLRMQSSSIDLYIPRTASREDRLQDVTPRSFFSIALPIPDEDERCVHPEEAGDHLGFLSQHPRTNVQIVRQSAIALTLYHHTLRQSMKTAGRVYSGKPPLNFI